MYFPADPACPVSAEGAPSLGCAGMRLQVLQLSLTKVLALQWPMLRSQAEVGVGFSFLLL